MLIWNKITQPPWRTVVPGGLVLLMLWLGYVLWAPGLDVRDGRHDRERNGIWLSHGWLGGDEWFIGYGKTNEFARYRDPVRIDELAARLRRHQITDVFPHLCPAESDGRLPAISSTQVENFLDRLNGFRVIPWVGGPYGASVRLHVPKWRAAFTTNVCALLLAHPRFAGVQLNIEPLPSGDTNFLHLLEQLRAALPPGKILSVAAYPPPTLWHPYSDVHWEEAYFREVARRCDQLAVMMYDAGQKIPKCYQQLMADWTREVLAWSQNTPVLLGLPTYDDAGVGYHDPQVENLSNALLGIHRGLSGPALPHHYQGVAIYCEWETGEEEWTFFQKHFQGSRQPGIAPPLPEGAVPNR